MEHRRKLIHITKMPIRWGDMDAYGHVNNTIYFRYMEQARVEWIEDMNKRGYDGRKLLDTARALIEKHSKAPAAKSPAKKA